MVLIEKAIEYARRESGSGVWRGRSLLDLGFLERDVLARDGIIFLERKLVSLGARVFLSHIEITGIGGRLELDLDHIAFGHAKSPELRAVSPET
jgi:hypothetical protein